MFRSANIVFPYTVLHPSPKWKKLKKKTSSKGNVQLFEVNDHFLISLLDLGKEYKMIKPFEATSIHSHLCSSHLLLWNHPEVPQLLCHLLSQLSTPEASSHFKPLHSHCVIQYWFFWNPGKQNGNSCLMLSEYFISKYLNTLILAFILCWENRSNLKCRVNFPFGMWPKLIGKGKWWFF